MDPLAAAQRRDPKPGAAAGPGLRARKPGEGRRRWATLWQKNSGAGGQVRRRARARAVSAAAVPATRPPLPFPVLPKAAQLLLVHPALHPGHRPVPNPPACPPSGQCSFSQGSYSQREAGKGSASSKVHAGGRPEGPSLSFPTPKRVGEGQSWRTGPELWNGRAGSPQGVCPHTQILSPPSPSTPSPAPAWGKVAAEVPELASGVPHPCALTGGEIKASFGHPADGHC